MGYVFDFKDSIAYEQWLEEAEQKDRMRRSIRLMHQMLCPLPGETLLSIGCGPGHELAYCIENDLNVTGLDPSPYMLDLSRKRIAHCAELYQGHAEDLPFDDNAFNHTIMIHSLEFVTNPEKAVEEACRVTKDRIFLGLMNKLSFTRPYPHTRRHPASAVYDHARFFSVWELKAMVRNILGDVPVSWRAMNIPSGRIPFLPHQMGLRGKSRISAIFKYSPFGAFIGMTVSPKPKFRTRPMKLKVRHGKQAPRTVTG